MTVIFTYDERERLRERLRSYARWESAHDGPVMDTIEVIIASHIESVLAQLEELCDERDEWLLEDRPKPWPPGTVHDALVSVTELRNFIASIREEDG